MGYSYRTTPQSAGRVNDAAPAPSADQIVHAQHDETGRMWAGPRSQLPRRYRECAAPASSADAAQPECAWSWCHQPSQMPASEYCAEHAPPAAPPAEPTATDAKCEMCDNVDYFGQRCHLHKGHAGTHHRAPAAPVKSAFQLIKGMAEKLRAVAGVVRSLDANDADAYLCEQAANNLAQFLGIYDWIPKYRNTAPATDDLVTRLNAATRPLIIYQSTDGTTTRKVLADDALRLQQLAREASIEVQRQARDIAEARQLFNKEYNEYRESRRRLREELSGERDRHKRTAERAERAEAELHKANIDSANLLAECSDMSVDIEKYRGEIAALRMAVKDDAQWAQENERLTKERDELRTMLQTTNQANGRLAEVADKYKGQSRELDRVKVQLTSEITAALAERDALRECVKAADAIRKYLPVGNGTVRNPHLNYSQVCLRAWDYDAARAKVRT